MLADRSGKLLSARGWHLAVAESATGGLIGHLITQIPGSSAYFRGGIIAYANSAKMNLLGVRGESLEQWGVVSPQVALEMAVGATQQLGAEVAISITGIAGPTGATAMKPVGLYYVGLAFPRERWVWRHILDEDRLNNNRAIAHLALEHLVKYLSPYGE